MSPNQVDQTLRPDSNGRVDISLQLAGPSGLIAWRLKSLDAGLSEAGVAPAPSLAATPAACGVESVDGALSRSAAVHTLQLERIGRFGALLSLETAAVTANEAQDLIASGCWDGRGVAADAQAVDYGDEPPGTRVLLSGSVPPGGVSGIDWRQHAPANASATATLNTLSTFVSLCPERLSLSLGPGKEMEELLELTNLRSDAVAKARVFRFDGAFATEAEAAKAVARLLRIPASAVGAAGGRNWTVGEVSAGLQGYPEGREAAEGLWAGADALASLSVAPSWVRVAGSSGGQAGGDGNGGSGAGASDRTAAASLALEESGLGSMGGFVNVPFGDAAVALLGVETGGKVTVERANATRGDGSVQAVDAPSLTGTSTAVSPGTTSSLLVGVRYSQETRGAVVGAAATAVLREVQAGREAAVSDGQSRQSLRRRSSLEATLVIWLSWGEVRLVRVGMSPLPGPATPRRSVLRPVVVGDGPSLFGACGSAGRAAEAARLGDAGRLLGLGEGGGSAVLPPAGNGGAAWVGVSGLSKANLSAVTDRAVVVAAGHGVALPVALLELRDAFGVPRACGADVLVARVEVLEAPQRAKLLSARGLAPPRGAAVRLTASGPGLYTAWLVPYAPGKHVLRSPLTSPSLLEVNVLPASCCRKGEVRDVSGVGCACSSGFGGRGASSAGGRASSGGRLASAVGTLVASGGSNLSSSSIGIVGRAVLPSGMRRGTWLPTPPEPLVPVESLTAVDGLGVTVGPESIGMAELDEAAASGSLSVGDGAGAGTGGVSGAVQSDATNPSVVLTGQEAEYLLRHAFGVGLLPPASGGVSSSGSSSSAAETSATQAAEDECNAIASTTLLSGLPSLGRAVLDAAEAAEGASSSQSSGSGAAFGAWPTPADVASALENRSATLVSEAVGACGACVEGQESGTEGGCQACAGGRFSPGGPTLSGSCAQCPPAYALEFGACDGGVVTARKQGLWWHSWQHTSAPVAAATQLTGSTSGSQGVVFHVCPVELNCQTRQFCTAVADPAGVVPGLASRAAAQLGGVGVWLSPVAGASSSASGGMHTEPGVVVSEETLLSVVGPGAERCAVSVQTFLLAAKALLDAPLSTTAEPTISTGSSSSSSSSSSARQRAVLTTSSSAARMTRALQAGSVTSEGSAFVLDASQARELVSALVSGAKGSGPGVASLAFALSDPQATAGTNGTATVEPAMAASDLGVYRAQVGQCAPGHTGVLCGECEDGWAVAGFGRCSKCLEEAWANWLILSAIVVVLSVFAVRWISRRVVRTRLRTTSSGAQRILLSFLQVLSLVTTLRTRAPKLLEGAGQVASGLGDGFSLELFPVACTLRPSFYTRLYTYAVLPLIAVCIAGVVVFGCCAPCNRCDTTGASKTARSKKKKKKQRGEGMGSAQSLSTKMLLSSSSSSSPSSSSSSSSGMLDTVGGGKMDGLQSNPLHAARSLKAGASGGKATSAAGSPGYAAARDSMDSSPTKQSLTMMAAGHPGAAGTGRHGGREGTDGGKGEVEDESDDEEADEAIDSALAAYAQGRTWCQRYGDLWVASSVVLVFLIYSRVFRALVDVFLVYPHPLEGSPRLQADLSVVADTPQHALAVAVASVALIAYAVGIPTAMVCLLCRSRRSLYPRPKPVLRAMYRSGELSPAVVEEEAEAVSTFRRFSFLYDGTRPSMYWWEVVVLTRKVCIALAGALLRSPVLQALVAGTVLALALVLHLLVKPYGLYGLNALEAASLSASLLVLFGSTLYWRVDTDLSSGLASPDSAAARETALTVCLLVAVIVTLALLLGAMAGKLSVKCLAACCGASRVEDALDAMDTFCRHRSMKKRTRGAALPKAAKTGHRGSSKRSSRLVWGRTKQAIVG